MLLSTQMLILDMDLATLAGIAPLCINLHVLNECFIHQHGILHISLLLTEEVNSSGKIIINKALVTCP